MHGRPACVLSRYTEHGDDPLAVRLVDMPADLPANLVVEEVLALSDLRNHHVEDVLPKFREAADEGRIKLDAFMGVFRTHFLKPHMSNLEVQYSPPHGELALA